MKVNTHIYKNGKWNIPFDTTLDSKNTLILIFASLEEEKVKEEVLKIAKLFHSSIISGASTSGEIFDDEVYDDTIVISITKFQSTTLKNHACKPISNETSYEDGVGIAKELFHDNLKGIFILSDGLKTNGSRLTQGIASVVYSDVVVSGGLAGDKDKFEKTWIIEDGSINEGVVCAVGFYGDNVHFQVASKGGWDSLGLTRVVTKSKDNVIYEFDGKSALEIYKRYLGDKVKDLPSSALLFPLELKNNFAAEEKEVRSVLGIDEEKNTLIFGGDIPQGSYVTFMKGNFNRLVNGASESAEKLDFSNYHNEPLLCIAISCVGRKLLLKSRIDEEIEAVEEVLPKDANVIGFYSYGEISSPASGICTLYNQTMSLTAIWESDA
ncbi:MAG: FIST C-terminal domain-containing protein [Sulfurimonas sp.]|nr:FIST C-terminal domain-containing protein [Sulfurimonas sp.]